MKCIKSIKPTKNTEVGQIVRIDDVEAESKVRTGYWSYISKTEWKLSRGKKATEEKTTEQVISQPTEQVEKKPYKKGQTSDKHKNKN
jgi:hypothetical protein